MGCFDVRLSYDTIVIYVSNRIQFNSNIMPFNCYINVPSTSLVMKLTPHIQYLVLPCQINLSTTPLTHSLTSKTHRTTSQHITSPQPLFRHSTKANQPRPQSSHCPKNPQLGQVRSRRRESVQLDYTLPCSMILHVSVELAEDEIISLRMFSSLLFVGR